MKLFALATILVCLAPSSTIAEIVVDQENVPPGWLGHIMDYVGDQDAQTFTVRNTGQITSVGLQLSFEWDRTAFAPVTDDLHFKLTRTNSAGDPLVENVLATYDISPYDLTTDYHGLPMLELDLDDQQVQVQSGDVLALVLSTNYTYKTHPERQYYAWAASAGDAIPGGFYYRYAPRLLGPNWSRQVVTDPTVTWDFGYRITIDTVPEPSAILLGALAFVALIGLPHRPLRT